MIRGRLLTLSIVGDFLLSQILTDRLCIKTQHENRISNQLTY